MRIEVTEGRIGSSDLFRQPNVVVWVEDTVDRMFWREMMPDGVAADYLIANGKDDLLKVSKETVDKRIPQIIAMDADYDELLEIPQPTAPRVVRTIRYSVENHLYTTDLIAEVVAVLCHQPECSIIDGQTWEKTVETVFAPLFVADLAKALSTGRSSGFIKAQTGCEEYLDESSWEPSREKVAEKAKSVSVPETERQRAEDIAAEISISHFIRGKFLFPCLERYLRHKIRTYSDKEYEGKPAKAPQATQPLNERLVFASFILALRSKPQLRDARLQERMRAAFEDVQAIWRDRTRRNKAKPRRGE